MRYFLFFLFVYINSTILHAKVNENNCLELFDSVPVGKKKAMANNTSPNELDLFNDGVGSSDSKVTSIDMFIRVLRDQQQYYPLKSDAAIERAIASAEEAHPFRDPLEREHFRAILRLAPIMETDLTYKALADELASTGLKTKKMATEAMNMFWVLNIEQQWSIVDGVVKRLSKVIDDKVSISNVTEVSKAAAKYRMSVQEYSQFLIRWNEAKTNGDFQEVRNAIMISFAVRGDLAVQRIAHFRSWPERLRGFIKEAFASHEEFKIDESSVDYLVSGIENSSENKKILKYLAKLTESKRIEFLENNYKKLNRFQLGMILEKFPHSGLISKKIENRLNLISEIASLNDNISELEEALVSNRLSLKVTQDKLSNEDREGLSSLQIKNVNELFRIARNEKEVKHTLDLFMKIFEDYGLLLNADNFFKIATVMLAETKRFRQPKQDLVIFDLLQNYSQLVFLSEDIISAIHTAIRNLTNAYRNSSNKLMAIKILERSWGRKVVTERERENLISTIQNLQAESEKLGLLIQEYKLRRSELLILLSNPNQ